MKCFKKASFQIPSSTLREIPDEEVKNLASVSLIIHENNISSDAEAYVTYHNSVEKVSNTDSTVKLIAMEKRDIEDEHEHEYMEDNEVTERIIYAQ